MIRVYSYLKLQTKPQLMLGLTILLEVSKNPTFHDWLEKII